MTGHLPMAKAQAQKIFAARLDGRDPAERKSNPAAAWLSTAWIIVETFIREYVAKIGTSRRIAGSYARCYSLLGRQEHS